MNDIKTLRNTAQIKKRKMLIVFGYMIADMLSNRKRDPTVTELFIKGRMLNNSPDSITQSYFIVSKSIGLNSTQYFITKIPRKWEL